MNRWTNKTRSVGVTQVWDDVHAAELLRSGEPEMAVALADQVRLLIQNGQKYQRIAWRRTLGRHWRGWWGLYVALAVVGLAISLPLTLAHPVGHWGGIAKKDVAYTAETEVVSWYKMHYPSDGAKKFDNGLYLISIGRVVRGPVHFWSARFSSDEFTKNFCVLANMDSFYVRECAA